MLFKNQYNLHNITKIEKCKHIVKSNIFSDKYTIKYVFKIIFNKDITAELYAQDTFYKSFHADRWVKASRMIKDKNASAVRFARYTETEELYHEACYKLRALLNRLHNDGLFTRQLADEQMGILKEKYPIFLNNIDNIYCGNGWLLNICEMIKKIEIINNENRKIKVIADNIRENRGKLCVSWHLEDYSFGDCKEWGKCVPGWVEGHIRATSALCETKCSLCGASVQNEPCICEVENNYVR